VDQTPRQFCQQSFQEFSMSDQVHLERKPPKRVQLDRFVVAVDGQSKSGYTVRELADAEALKIRQAYPRVSVTVIDQEQDDTSLLSGYVHVPSSAEDNEDQDNDADAESNPQS
jgi:hypothetical protein